VQVARLEEISGGEVVQVGEEGGFAAGEGFSFTDALVVCVVRGDFECHVAGGELEAVDAGSAPISDKFTAAAHLSEAVPDSRGEVDDMGRVGIHHVSVAANSNLRRVFGLVPMRSPEDSDRASASRGG